MRDAADLLTDDDWAMVTARAPRPRVLLAAFPQLLADVLAHLLEASWDVTCMSAPVVRAEDHFQAAVVAGPVDAVVSADVVVMFDDAPPEQSARSLAGAYTVVLPAGSVGRLRQLLGGLAPPTSAGTPPDPPAD